MIVILIPCYEPDQRLVDLVRGLQTASPEHGVVIVNDGSGPTFDRVFEAVARAGVDVIGHDPNRGKGFALKAGLRHIAQRYPGADIVCADADGQHAVADILRVASAVQPDDRTIVLGARRLDTQAPVRSRVGNAVTRVLFHAASGARMDDTQTGLRGYPAELIPWLLSVPGDRYEYELSVLLGAGACGLGFREVPIDTIYLEHNQSSHFRAVRDSIRVYTPLLCAMGRRFVNCWSSRSVRRRRSRS
jgi:glycosyltransferase involved in cell wall biosynthesis